MLISAKEKVTQKQYLRMTHTYDLIEPKCRRKRENKIKRKRNKHIASLRRPFCIILPFCLFLICR